MIVHVIASKSNITRDYPNLKLIVDTLRELGHSFARDWIEKEYKFAISGKPRESINWQLVNKENLEALARADVVIAEASAKSFSVGYQVATALQQKKPTLILTNNDALKGTFGSGISSDFLHLENYTQDNLRMIISDFLSENKIDNKDLRFNFFIDRQIYNYLRWAAYKTGKNKSEILRDLILREIEKSDS